MQTDSFEVYAGPILRKTTEHSVAFWLALNTQPEIELTLFFNSESIHLNTTQLEQTSQVLKAGENLYFYLLDIELTEALPSSTEIHYNLTLNGHEHSTWAPSLTYPNHDYPFFIIQPNVSDLLHGSCRKPHYPSEDGLVTADTYLRETPTQDWPSLMMMSGDQVYTDDVAGPMLKAIHQLIPHLGMPDESLDCIAVDKASDLHTSAPHYYSREALLPNDKTSQNMVTKVFSGAKKPIFTTDTAHNHLISLAECLAMYLLTWSPNAWQLIDNSVWQLPENLDNQNRKTFESEAETLQNFVQGLSQVRRVMAHLPSAMIFDDHDVTDDWNLSAAWEETAYGHPFSNRIIGNAIISYAICQAWGNNPKQFNSEFWMPVQAVLNQPGKESHNELIHQLNRFRGWGYCWQTQPPLIVLDTRTQRWRSEKNPNNPSGLMDWESLSDLQQELLDLDAVILVSPAPMFGVKLIETIQKIFTWIGKPLLVDAENWMAHPGSAHSLMNLFRHKRTPKHFVILSGDVHYSFVYRLELRNRQKDHQPDSDLWQITSSGIKNEFPKTLLDIFDRLNRWLYSPRSPLNWFTRRRRMKVIPHKPETAKRGERLLNASGIGLVQLHDDGSPKNVFQLSKLANSSINKVAFKLSNEDARWE